MKSTQYIILFLFYSTIKICQCSFESYVDFDISQEQNIQRFPWMVTISKVNPESLVAYGTLIHEKAVLTLSVMRTEQLSHFDFQVSAECYFPENVTNFHCNQVRNVSEYSVIKQLKDDLEGNLAVLILTKAFKLSKTVNTIHFAQHDIAFNHNKCAIISLKTLESSYGVKSKARLMTSTQVKIILNPDHYSEYKLSLVYQNLTLYDDEDRPEVLKNETSTHVMDFSGGPVVCRSTHVENRWLLVGVINFAIVVRNHQIEYTTTGEVSRVDISDTQKIITKIIKASILSENHPSRLIEIE